MRQLARVRTPSGADYPVVVGSDAAEMLEAVWRESWRQVAIIGDETTSGLFSARLAAALRPRTESVLELRFPPGEAHKTRATKERLEDALLEAGFDRHCCIVAVGGGIALDVAGFVAATYLRGVAHINVATSLLAQVDAAVGGKTGVNTPHGKNLIGSFHHPRAVIIDRGALASLPAAELCFGLAEAVKHAVLADVRLFGALEKWDAAGDGLIPPDALLARCVEIKAEVVQRDEHEAAYRQVLNFGHTVAHALETASDHRIHHGEAVAMGLAVEARVAERLCGFPADETERLVSLLRRLGLPTRPALEVAEVAPLLRQDKKTRGGRVHCALPERIGVMHAAGGRWVLPVPAELLESAWQAAIEQDRT